MPPVRQFRQHRPLGKKLPFPVADGEFQQVQALGENTVGGQGLEVHPGVPEITAVVGDQGGEARPGPPRQIGENA